MHHRRVCAKARRAADDDVVPVVCMWMCMEAVIVSSVLGDSRIAPDVLRLCNNCECCTVAMILFFIIKTRLLPLALHALDTHVIIA